MLRIGQYDAEETLEKLRHEQGVLMSDIEVTESDRDDITDGLDNRLTGGADSLPDEYRHDLVEGFARLNERADPLQKSGTMVYTDRRY